MRRTEPITLSLGEGDKERLEAIALEFGCVWGDRPNVSELVKAIAQGRLRVERADATFTENSRRAALLGAIALIQEGLAKIMQLERQ